MTAARVEVQRAIRGRRRPGPWPERPITTGELADRELLTLAQQLAQPLLTGPVTQHPDPDGPRIVQVTLSARGGGWLVYHAVLGRLPADTAAEALDLFNRFAQAPQQFAGCRTTGPEHPLSPGVDYLIDLINRHAR